MLVLIYKNNLDHLLNKFNYKFPRSLFVPPSLHLRYAFAIRSLCFRSANECRSSSQRRMNEARTKA